MAKPKGKESVKSAVARIYPELPRKFSMVKLHAMVAREICRPQVFMDTVRRKRDELRKEGVIHFKCIDRQRSLYQKQERL